MENKLALPNDFYGTWIAKMDKSAFKFGDIFIPKLIFTFKYTFSSFDFTHEVIDNIKQKSLNYFCNIISWEETVNNHPKTKNDYPKCFILKTKASIYNVHMVFYLSEDKRQMVSSVLNKVPTRDFIYYKE
jgi:hypothetical protein